MTARKRSAAAERADELALEVWGLRIKLELLDDAAGSMLEAARSLVSDGMDDHRSVGILVDALARLEADAREIE